MLSTETSIEKWPVQVVRVLLDIAQGCASSERGGISLQRPVGA